MDLLHEKCRIRTFLDHGEVELLDCMPRVVQDGENGDDTIVNAARRSYGDKSTHKSNKRDLIRYLYRHEHMSPFEMVQFTFRARVPIFVRAQWFRHRTMSANEFSARYSVLPDVFYRPSVIHEQSPANKQGRAQPASESAQQKMQQYLDICHDQYSMYEELLDMKVSREEARMGLSQNIYTEFVFSMNLRNLLHALHLRRDKTAQYEIRVFADAIFAIIQPLCPETIQAYLDYTENAVTFSAGEMEALMTIVMGTKLDVGSPADVAMKIPNPDFSRFFRGNKRETEEFMSKVSKIHPSLSIVK